MTLAYPLQWPLGVPRSINQSPARFRVSLRKAHKNLLHELRLLGAEGVVVSSNLELKRNGEPYANQPNPADVGVAVYFELDGERYCKACDRWTLPEDNVHAIGLTIGALRGIERWGTSEDVRRVFSGFKALPPEGSDWRAVFGVQNGASLEDVKAIYRKLAAVAHPDVGGNPHEMSRLNQAWEAAQKALS